MEYTEYGMINHASHSLPLDINNYYICHEISMNKEIPLTNQPTN